MHTPRIHPSVSLLLVLGVLGCPAEDDAADASTAMTSVPSHSETDGAPGDGDGDPGDGDGDPGDGDGEPGDGEPGDGDGEPGDGDGDVDETGVYTLGGDLEQVVAMDPVLAGLFGVTHGVVVAGTTETYVVGLDGGPDNPQAVLASLEPGRGVVVVASPLDPAALREIQVFGVDGGVSSHLVFPGSVAPAYSVWPGANPPIVDDMIATGDRILYAAGGRIGDLVGKPSGYEAVPANESVPFMARSLVYGRVAAIMDGGVAPVMAVTNGFPNLLVDTADLDNFIDPVGNDPGFADCSFNASSDAVVCAVPNAGDATVEFVGAWEPVSVTNPVATGGPVRRVTAAAVGGRYYFLFPVQDPAQLRVCELDDGLSGDPLGACGGGPMTVIDAPAGCSQPTHAAVVDEALVAVSCGQDATLWVEDLTAILPP